MMRHNTQLCYSLTMANYFFGHNAKTLIEQVDASMKKKLTESDFHSRKRELALGLDWVTTSEPKLLWHLTCLLMIMMSIMLVLGLLRKSMKLSIGS